MTACRLGLALAAVMTCTGAFAEEFGNEIEAWTPAAEAGDPVAQELLGLMYRRSKEYSEAADWFRRAAKQGRTKAQIGLGWMYESGEGVPLDPARAHMWYDIAAENRQGVGSDYPWIAAEVLNRAAAYRQRVAARMTETEIAEARRMARICATSDNAACD
ncbi:tetratricopeptide repeat protein [Rhodovulum marinum]|uniref:Sel1 repeat-containing protein n=1 Tax=Rhodovulum marinum TaxID=320662 RepID=A0A4R2PZV1_9RHOB|nr:tetratricopeptide repeat protein [Rhodovulum marinum]TCP40914.1 Sel1 repeat-containing protein [Rhodovulum marinum]